VVRSMNLLSRPTSEIFIHLAIKDIATIISLNFRSPTRRLRTRNNGLSSTVTRPDNAVPSAVSRFLDSIV
jgi:hypothetical protein